jgi:hypothetical protein
MLTINFPGLPSDLKKDVASFLRTKDVHFLNQTSRAVHADLCLSTLAPAFQLYSSSHWNGDSLTGDHPLCGRKIPIFFGSSIHSIILTCRWRDQGWGNRKGQLFVLGFPDSENRDPDNLSFSDGRLAYRSQIAPHAEERLKFSFKRRRNEIYYIWFKAGGGGGHELQIADLIVHTAVFDDRDRTLAKTFQALSNMGVVSLPPARWSSLQPQTPGFNGLLLLLAVIVSLKSAISRNEAPDLILSQFLASNNIDVNEATIVALEELVQYVQQYSPVEHGTSNE